MTGASRGIGRATALQLAKEGRLVVLVSRKADTLEEVRAAIVCAGGAAEIRACDVADGEALNAMIEEVASTHGRLDILVNNAGMTRDGLILRMSDADFDDVININLRSAFIACRAAAQGNHRQRDRAGFHRHRDDRRPAAADQGRSRQERSGPAFRHG